MEKKHSNIGNETLFLLKGNALIREEDWSQRRDIDAILSERAKRFSSSANLLTSNSKASSATEKCMLVAVDLKSDYKHGIYLFDYHFNPIMGLYSSKTVVVLDRKEYGRNLPHRKRTSSL